MKQNDIYKTLGWVIPLGCLLIAGFIVWIQYGRHQRASDEKEQLTSRHAALQRTVEQLRGDRPQERVASVPQTEEEEQEFLTDLRNAALSSGVSIVRWTSTSRPAGTSGAAADKQPEALKGVTAIASDMTIRGQFDAMRGFLLRLRTNPRLLNVTNITWKRDGGTTDLTMTVTRYVNQPETVTSLVNPDRLVLDLPSELATFTGVREI